MSRKLLVVAIVLLIGTVGCGAGGTGGGTGGGGQPPHEFDTPQQLMDAATPAWQPSGPTESIKGVSFQHSADWEVTLYDDAVEVDSPVNTFGEQCWIFVLEPRPVASTDDGRFDQALQVASDLFLKDGATMTDDYERPDPLSRAFRGSTGSGWDYAGLMMRLVTPDSVFDVLSLIARSGNNVVPILAIEPRDSGWGCVGDDGQFSLDVANVFYSLDMGSAQPDHSLEPKMVGEWFSSSGSAGNSYVFGANGQYIHASAAGGWTEITPGVWSDRYATWAGDGSWVAVGDVIGMFPKEQPAESRFGRQFEFRDYGGDWQDTLCWVDAYEGDPYTYCTQRTED